MVHRSLAKEPGNDLWEENKILYRICITYPFRNKLRVPITYIDERYSIYITWKAITIHFMFTIFVIKSMCGKAALWVNIKRYNFFMCHMVCSTNNIIMLSSKYLQNVYKLVCSTYNNRKEKNCVKYGYVNYI